MPNPIGASFAPTSDNAERARRGEVRGGPAQSGGDALRVLNFRVDKPRVGGGNSGVSPLQGQQGLVGSGFGNAVVQSVLKTVFGAGAFSSNSGGIDGDRSNRTGGGVFNAPSDGDWRFPGGPVPKTPDPNVIIGTAPGSPGPIVDGDGNFPNPPRDPGDPRKLPQPDPIPDWPMPPGPWPPQETTPQAPTPTAPGSPFQGTNLGDRYADKYPAGGNDDNNGGYGF